MNKSAIVLSGFRDIYNKTVFLNKHTMEEKLKDFTASEVHCIEYVEQHPESNVTKLSEAFYMTRGAISKLTKKLMDRGILESYQKPDNKKEIFFKLTEAGKAVFDLHESLHDVFYQRDRIVFDQIEPHEYDAMIRFLNLYISHLDAEIQKQALEFSTPDDI